MDRNQKLLIIYENTGGGHAAMARILSEIASTPPGYEVMARAGSELVPGVTVTVLIAAWNFFIRHNLIRLADWAMNYWVRAVMFPIGEVTEVDRLFEQLDRLAPDVIVLTTDGYTKVLGEWARLHRVPFFVFLTDLAVFYDMVHPDAVHLCYFPATVDALRAFSFDSTYFSMPIRPETPRLRRMAYVLRAWWDLLSPWRPHRLLHQLGTREPLRNHARCVALGPLREARHHAPRDRQAARAQAGLQPGERCVLVLSGSIGGHFLRQVVTWIGRAGLANLRLLAVTGQDTATRAWLSNRLGRYDGLRCEVLPYVTNLPELLAAADVVVARPSCGVFLEALLARTPMLVPARVTVNDRGAVDLLRQHELGATFDSPESLGCALARLLERGPEYRQRIEAHLAGARSFDELTRQLRTLLDEAREAAGRDG